VSAQTHVATAHAVLLSGLTPVFADSELKTGNIDLDAVESKITSKTRAISVVHYLGWPVDMERLMNIANKHNLYVVEDCALAIGARIQGRHAGLWGDTGSFSFYPVKHMTTAEGGMLITHRNDIHSQIHHARAFGVDRFVGERTTPGEYDVKSLGFNYRMNEIEAAIGRCQIKRLNNFLKKRKDNYRALEKGLKNIDEIELFDTHDPQMEGAYYCLNMRLKNQWASLRPNLIQEINRQGVGTSIYYPKPVCLFSYYQDLFGLTQSDVPNASIISSRSIALPVGPHLGPDQIQRIIEVVQSAIAKEIKSCRT
jgi:dTDP-4-amino-4,6-dideoxygalactose transaminase